MKLSAKIIILIIGIFFICIGVILNAVNDAVQLPPALSTETFYERMESVELDLQAILGVNEHDLFMRLVKHPLKNRVGVPLHARKRLIAITKEEASKIEEEYLRQLKEKGVFYDSENDMKRVIDITKRIIDILPEKIPMNILLANTECINAMSFIGGSMIVTRGALEYFHDDELAFVIAHEYGHALARHSAESLTKGIVSTQLGQKITKGTQNNLEQKENSKTRKIISIGYNLITIFGFQLPYSRTMENEADALGIAYMKKAGFDVEGALKTMQRFAEDDKDNNLLDEWLSTHPLSEKRLKRLRTYAAYESGNFLTQAVEEDSDIVMDWAYGAMKMLEEADFKEQKVDEAKGDVIFIPGIFMDKAEEYVPFVSKAYPKYNIAVLQWVAISKLSWKQAVYRANMLSKYLVNLLQDKKEEDLRKLILVGHSLGARVVIKTADEMDKKGIKVKQIVLLGGAVPYNSPELASCENVSLDNPYILFNPADRTLKYAYYLEEHIPALGLLGSKSTMHRFEEYRVSVTENEVTEKKSLVETVVESHETHAAELYFNCLDSVYRGIIAKEMVKIDQNSIAYPIKLPITVPSVGGKVLEKYQEWDVIAYPRPGWGFRKKKTMDDNAPAKMFYVIRNPYGEFCGWAFDEESIRYNFAEKRKKIDQQIYIGKIIEFIDTYNWEPVQLGIVYLFEMFFLI